MRKVIFAGIAATAVFGFVAPSYAHHSTNLWFDMGKRQTLEGTVVALKWINPHAILQFEVKEPDGTARIYSAETHNTAVLARSGWKPNMFKPGDKITVTGQPSRKGLPQMGLMEVKTESGKIYTQTPVK